jgi:hypothetical protein
MKSSVSGFMVVVMVAFSLETSAQQSPFPGVYCPNIPDNNQPPAGSWGCPVDNFCNPVSMVNITEYWDLVVGHPNAIGVNAGLPAPEVADYIGYFMATNGISNPQCASPLRMNPSLPGTWPIDTEMGGFEYVRWDTANQFPPLPPPGIPPGKAGYDWAPFSDFISGFPYYQSRIDTCLPPIVIFHYWNPQPTGIQLVDTLSNDIIDLYLQGPPILNSGDNNPENPEEFWPCAFDPDSCPDPELIGHAVTGVGYAAGFDPDSSGPLPLTDWIVCHDNWHTTATNVMIEWAAWHATISFDPNLPVAVEEAESAVPSGFWLGQNSPNPFNSSTTISYRILNPAHVSLRIYNLQGQEIETLLDKSQTAGDYQVIWNAGDVPSGIYFYRLRSGGLEETRKLILLK